MSDAPVGGQFLSFYLADEEYAVNILEVQEIKGWQPVTRIPNAPPHVLGVINLRGIVVPVLDLRRRFDLPVKPVESATVVIVIHLKEARTERTVGLVVDAVATVYDIGAEMVREAPDLGSGIGNDFILGLATIEARMVILLDMPVLVNQGLFGLGSLDSGNDRVAA
ncbi:MAG: purine-binding chemotaxis protein CheW [Gammaproteobacteria bacterium]|nr:purine-binding chemotaxis protein CheW [Gammaproteobacteria bacterium]